MKRIRYLLFFCIVFLALYTAFLFLFPVKKKGFYTNEDRMEAFVYSKDAFPIVMVGSSLTGVLDKDALFKQDYFSLYALGSGGCTGVEVLRRIKEVPAVLYFEMNYIHKGIDSPLLRKLFAEPGYTAKKYLPFLLKQNMLLPGIVDRLKKRGKDTIDIERPSLVVYNALVAAQDEAWGHVDTSRLNRVFDRLTLQLRSLAGKGCKICFFEMPMDVSLRYAPLLDYERRKVRAYIQRYGGSFIPSDTSRVYNTADGVHLLAADAVVYNRYLMAQLNVY